MAYMILGPIPGLSCPVTYPQENRALGREETPEAPSLSDRPGSGLKIPPAPAIVTDA